LHFLPHHAPAIGRLVSEFRKVPVILDHLGRAGMGTAADAESVVRLADGAAVYMKFSGWRYFPESGRKAFVRRVFDAFGRERILWGGLGHSMKEHETARREFDEIFAFANDDARARIRGRNAAALFRF
jgi:predicted TIM-barrel fold metal-dependent hydrolase